MPFRVSTSNPAVCDFSREQFRLSVRGRFCIFNDPSYVLSAPNLVSLSLSFLFFYRFPIFFSRHVRRHSRITGNNSAAKAIFRNAAATVDGRVNGRRRIADLAISSIPGISAISRVNSSGARVFVSGDITVFACGSK